MSDLITNLIPRGKPVTLGSRVYLVPEARLSDLADLQAWLDARQADPLDGLAEAADSAPDPVAADRLLLEALDRADDGGPSYDSIEGTALLYTTEGKYAFLAIALRRCSPRGHLDLADDPSPITDAQFDRLRRVFFGFSDAREIHRLLKFPGRGRPNGRLLTWGEAIDGLARSHGWTYEAIYGLTLSEFGNARRQGRPLETGFQGTTADLVTMEQRIRLARPEFFPEAEPATPTPQPDVFAGEWIMPTKEVE
jgi:hypothetical protein